MRFLLLTFPRQMVDLIIAAITGIVEFQIDAKKNFICEGIKMALNTMVGQIGPHGILLSGYRMSKGFYALTTAVENYQEFVEAIFMVLNKGQLDGVDIVIQR